MTIIEQWQVFTSIVSNPLIEDFLISYDKSKFKRMYYSSIIDSFPWMDSKYKIIYFSIDEYLTSAPTDTTCNAQELDSFLIPKINQLKQTKPELFL